jgi:phosphoenolpyruvate-protein kinase (PTS system EI component)
MQLLAKEEAVLKQRVANLENSSIRNCPGTSTGFNVIRSRVDTCGRPLETEALRKERERLATALRKFDAEIASAKAEIATNTRKDEIEIWETKLVAMQVGDVCCFCFVRIDRI